MWIQSGDKEPIVVLVLGIGGDPLVGKTDIKLKVRRRGAGAADEYLDWSDNTFKPVGSVTTLLADLEEVSSSDWPGEYRLNRPGHAKGFNTGSVTNPVEDDVYFFMAIQDGGSDAINLPQVGQLRTGGVLDDIYENRSPVLWGM